MGKLTFLAGVGVGYVLGAKAGRSRYEQIKAGARNVASNPKVQNAAAQAKDFAVDKAPVVQEKVTEVAAKAKETVADKMHSNGDSGSTATTTMTAEPAPASGPPPDTYPAAETGGDFPNE